MSAKPRQLYSNYQHFLVGEYSDHNTTKMEDDRAQVDLGVAVDTEHRLDEPVIPKVPKKRYVGRRQADLAASKNNTSFPSDGGAIQGDA